MRYDTKPIITTLSKKHKTAIMRKGVAKCYCVGGSVSCIGAWEVAASHVLPLFISMALFYSITQQIARSFQTVRKGRFLLFRGRLCMVTVGGWPATDEGLGAVRKAGCKAGNKVGSAPWNIPAVGLGETRGLVPVGYSVAVIP